MKEFELEKRYKNIISYGPGGKYHWYYGFFMEDDKKLFSENDRKILGEHNLDNICAALGVADLIGLSLDVCHKSIKSFTGLPYRMENLGIYGGIEWINDAISTTPQSTIQAIRTFGKKIGTIFLGGKDRGYDFEHLVHYVLKYKIHNIILFPETGEKILELLEAKIQDLRTLNILETTCMKEAVAFALKNTKEGETALLSTASPSYSVWKNFEEKGDLFKQYVKELTSS